MELQKEGIKIQALVNTVVIPGLKNQLLAQSVRVTSRKMVTKLVRKMQERVDKN